MNIKKEIKLADLERLKTRKKDLLEGIKKLQGTLRIIEIRIKAKKKERII